jgi:hypothetical protein
MRRILRKIAAGEFDALGDISTLADPSVKILFVSYLSKVKFKYILRFPPFSKFRSFSD